MTKSTGERIYRACTRCRHRKVKCDLKTIGENGKPPCVNCHNDGLHCVLADSSRGGDYSRYRLRTAKTLGRASGKRRAKLQDEVTAATRSNHESGSGIQNPLQALELLAKVAASENNNSVEERSKSLETTNGGDSRGDEIIRTERNDPMEVAAGTLPWNGLDSGDLPTLTTLLEGYHDTYHVFLPLVPRDVLSPRNIYCASREEPFVLTAVLLIATKDRPEHAAIHASLWESMEKMLLQVVLGAKEVRTVGCVEGLLILAEWVPHADASLSNISHRGNGGLAGTEDTAAWTLVGLAVRQAYLLHLDKYAFRGDAPEDENAALHRKRLAWTFTYIADRQISIRMGQAFWCRGPSLATKFTAADFPTLQPHNAYEDDYASVLQAQLELTVLFGNIHDLLYASKPRTISLMLQGDYIKYLDDSMQGLAAWKQNWNQLEVGAHLKLLLDLKYEYLRLYVHGFAFQAAMSRTPGTPPHSNGDRFSSRFPHGVLATPDGRHITLGISAAKSVLTMLGHRISPTRHLRFLGPRFYLYAIHCAVFLYKATCYGAIGAEERQECVKIIQRYINNLDATASCAQHIAARHSVLLTSLWIRKETHNPSPDSEPTVTVGVNNINQFLQVPPTSTMQTSAPDLLIPPELNNMQNYMPDLTGMVAPPRYSAMPPETFVTGLYGTNQQFNDFDIYNFMDLGAYGEPDLRNLISSVAFDE